MTYIGRTHFAYLVAFILVCIIDPVAFSLQLAGVPKLPFGLAGIALTIGLVLREQSLTAGRRMSVQALVLGFGYIVLMLLALSSHNFQLADVWIWAQNATYFFLGVFSASFLLKMGLSNSLKLAASGSVALSATLWFLFSDRIYVSGEIDKLNYLYVSDSVAILGLFLLSAIRATSPRIVLVSLVAVALYLVGSRFGLIAFSCASVAMILKSASWSLRALVVVGLIVGTVALLGYVESLGFEINDNRFVRLLLFTESDTSLNARIEDDDFSRDVFLANPLRGGGYKFYVVNGEGTYAHNALSIIYEFGVFGMCFLLTAVVIIGRSLWRLLGTRHESIAIGFSVFFLLATFAKFYLWWGYFFLMGYLIVCADLRDVQPARLGLDRTKHISR